MSTPPPSPASGSREFVLPLEGGRRRHGAVLRLGALGAVFEHPGALRRPLQVPLGTLQLGLVDPGPARTRAATGRFPILKRLGATAVVPREHGVEGWLWTSLAGSALTMLDDEDEAPNAGLLFTKPLAGEAVRCFLPEAAERIAARSPLGSPAVYGLLLRVADVAQAEDVFRRFALLKPLTDREVAPTLRRSLPSDRSPDPVVARGGEDARAATSVAPPGLR